MKEFLKPYSPFAQFLLIIVSAALISYGVYDAQTLQALIGTLTGIATAFWAAYDKSVLIREKVKADAAAKETETK